MREAVNSKTHFTHVCTTELITIPEFLFLEDLVSSFKKDFKPFAFSDEFFKEKNYSSSKMKMFSGVPKYIHLFSFNKSSSLEDSVRFISKNESTILPGASGLLIAWQFLKDKIPNNALLYGFDERKSLYHSKSGNGAFLVPCINTHNLGLIAGCYNVDSIPYESEMGKYLFYFDDI